MAVFEELYGSFIITFERFYGTVPLELLDTFLITFPQFLENVWEVLHALLSSV